MCTYCGKVAMSALQNEPSGNISVDKEDLQLSMEAEPHAYSHWGSKKRTSQDLPRSVNIHSDKNTEHYRQLTFL